MTKGNVQWHWDDFFNALVP